MERKDALPPRSQDIHLDRLLMCSNSPVRALRSTSQLLLKRPVKKWTVLKILHSSSLSYRRLCLISWFLYLCLRNSALCFLFIWLLLFLNCWNFNSNYSNDFISLYTVFFIQASFTHLVISFQCAFWKKKKLTFDTNSSNKLNFWSNIPDTD